MTKAQERTSNGAKIKNDIFDKDSNSSETSKLALLLVSEISQFEKSEHLSMFNKEKYSQQLLK